MPAEIKVVLTDATGGAGGAPSSAAFAPQTPGLQPPFQLEAAQAGGAGTLLGGLASLPAKIGDAVAASFRIAQQAAGGDNTGAVGSAALKIGEGLTKLGGFLEGFGPVIGTVGIGLGKFGEVVTAGTVAIKAMTDAAQAFSERGRQLAPFSPQLSQASAQQDFARLQMQMSEAQQLGPELARLMSAQSEFDRSLNEALMPIKTVVIQTLSDFLKTAKPILEEFGAFLKVISPLLREIGSFMVRAIAWFSEVLLALAKIPFGVGDAFKKAANDMRERGEASPFADFWNSMSPANLVGKVPMGEDPIEQGAQARMAMPAFAR